MSRRQMVRKKATQVALVVYHHELNQLELVAEVIKYCLGYEDTQSYNCAHMVINRGEYVVKTFKVSEMEKARTILQLFIDQEVPAKLLPI